MAAAFVVLFAFTMDVPAMTIQVGCSGEGLVTAESAAGVARPHSPSSALGRADAPGRSRGSFLRRRRRDGDWRCMVYVGLCSC